MDLFPLNLTSFLFNRLDDSSFEGTVDAICQVWPNSNLIAKALGITGDMMREYAILLVTRAIKEGLSTVCIDRTKNKVVGFVIVEDLNSPPLPESAKHLGEAFQIWMEYTAQVESPYHQRFKEPGEQTIHISMTGILPGYEGLYLARIGLLLAMRHAKTKGYDKLFSVLTHKGSQSIASQRFVSTLYQVQFKTFEFPSGHFPLAHVELECANIALLDLKAQTEYKAFTKRMNVLKETHISRFRSSRL